mgnify:CR=1 FL=1
MALVGVLALLYLGTLLVTEGAGGLVGPSGRRLLSRLRGFPLGLAALLLGAASGSGTGLSRLGRGLLQVGVLPLHEAALLPLGATKAPFCSSAKHSRVRKAVELNSRL